MCLKYLVENDVKTTQIPQKRSRKGVLRKRS